MREAIAWTVRAYPHFWAVQGPVEVLGPYPYRWRAVLAALVFKARHGRRSRVLIDPVLEMPAPEDVW